HAPLTTFLYTLSLHDALPIFTMDDRQVLGKVTQNLYFRAPCQRIKVLLQIRINITTIGVLHYDQILFGLWSLCNSIYFKYQARKDRKSTRLNSSHLGISYAVF